MAGAQEGPSGNGKGDGGGGRGSNGRPSRRHRSNRKGEGHLRSQQVLTNDQILYAFHFGLFPSVYSSHSLYFTFHRINPLYDLTETKSSPSGDSPPQEVSRDSTEKSASSGYGGSHDLFTDHRTTKRPGASASASASVSASASSGTGTLDAIPEGGNIGRDDDAVPRPIWPYDSLVDETLLLYTSLNYAPDSLDDGGTERGCSVREVLVELLQGIRSTMEGGEAARSAEDMLRVVDETIARSLEALRRSSEREVGNLCVNLSNSRKITSVARAFANCSTSSSSGNSSQRGSSVETEEELYRSSSSSSSGFSDSLCTSKLVIVKDTGCVVTPNKKSLLVSSGDEKPSVWEQYYGMRVDERAAGCRVVRPTDVPLFVSIFEIRSMKSS